MEKIIKILAFDIETQYATAGVWSLWDQNVSLNQLFDAGGLLCYAARYVGESKMHFRKKGDKDFLTHMHTLINEADALLTYNGKKFDIKKLNKEWLVAGMKPPAPIPHIDLCQVVKGKFGFISNKLQHVSEQLGIGSKTKHEGFDLWIKCAKGDKAAWALMEKYNKQDVVLLEKLYDKLKGWIPNHPSFSLATESHVCPNCGGKHLQLRGFHVTKVSRFQRLQCQTCGTWSRERVNEVHPDNRKRIVTAL